jgi:DNA-binding beta-propeller fold protein YncE
MRNVLLATAILLVSALDVRAQQFPTPTPSGTFYIGTYSKKIMVMDEATMRITDSIPVSIGIPIGVQLSYDRKHFYVQEPRFESVEIFDVATRKSLGSFTLSSGNRTVRLSGMSVDPTERFAVMVVKIFTKRPDRFEISTPKLLTYDLATRTVTDTIPWPRGEERDFASVMFSPDGENMYFFTGEDVLIYDTKTLKQVERWEIARAFFEEGFGRLPTGFATQQLYEEPGYFTSLFRVTDPVNRRTLMGIARTNLIQRSIDWFMLGPPGPSAPGGITLAPGRKRAYGLVQQVGNWQFWTFDLENKRVLNKIEFKGRPRMSITAGTDGKVIYLHGAGSTVDVRDVNTFEVIRTIELPGDMTSFMLMPPAPRPSGPGH